MEHHIKIFFFLDQEDFGDKRNCSLTSITSICYTRFRTPSEREIYNIVESIGKNIAIMINEELLLYLLKIFLINL